jgi:hypothetical protein
MGPEGCRLTSSGIAWDEHVLVAGSFGARPAAHLSGRGRPVVSDLTPTAVACPKATGDISRPGVLIVSCAPQGPAWRSYPRQYQAGISGLPAQRAVTRYSSPARSLASSATSRSLCCAANREPAAQTTTDRHADCADSVPSRQRASGRTSASHNTAGTRRQRGSRRPHGARPADAK